MFIHHDETSSGHHASPVGSARVILGSIAFSHGFFAFVGRKLGPVRGIDQESQERILTEAILCVR